MEMITLTFTKTCTLKPIFKGLCFSTPKRYWFKGMAESCKCTLNIAYICGELIQSGSGNTTKFLRIQTFMQMFNKCLRQMHWNMLSSLHKASLVVVWQEHDFPLMHVHNRTGWHAFLFMLFYLFHSCWVRT